MRKFFKRLGIILGSLVGLILVGLYISTNVRLNKTYTVQAVTITIPSDPASIERGQHVAVIRMCTECNGANLAGRIFLDDPVIGQIATTNLTSGKGGVDGELSDTD